jgi:hypothetical protein
VRRDLGALLGVLVSLASEAYAAPTQDPAPVLTSTRPDAWVAPNDTFHVVIRRPDTTATARLAAVIGTTDVTALFTAHGDTLTYRAHPIGLPAGEHELTVYLVDDLTGWTRHGAVPLRVRNRAGFERASISPALVFTSEGQAGGGPRSTPDVRHAPLEDVSVTAGLQSMHTREGVSLRTQSNFLGASNRGEALRFAERPLDAPKVDLVDYIVTVERGSGSVSLGHVGFGQHRHLINGFASRGASASAKWGSIATLSLAALNGTTVVGFSNPTGISEPDHRIAGGSHWRSSFSRIVRAGCASRRPPSTGPSFPSQASSDPRLPMLRQAKGLACVSTRVMPASDSGWRVGSAAVAPTFSPTPLCLPDRDSPVSRAWHGVPGMQT